VRDLLDEFWPDALERLRAAVERDHARDLKDSKKTRRGAT
jgi:hypothetical protein